MKDLQKAIEKWIKKNKGDVSFIGSFTALDKEGEVIDEESLIFGYGDRDLVEISLGELNSQLEKDKEDFINW